MSETTQSQEAASGLQIADLLKILEILNVCSARGAIKPDEMTVVGGVYERIYTFLDASGAIPPGAKAQAEEPAKAE